MKFMSLNFHHCSVVSLLALKRKMVKTRNPPALGGIICSFDHELRRKNYQHSITYGPGFAKVRDTLKMKQK